MRLQVGSSSFVCCLNLAALANACAWLVLKTLRRLGDINSFVWFDSNLLQQVSVAVVQISDRKVSWSAFRLQYFEFVIVAARNISCHGRKISVDLTSSAIVVASVHQCTAMYHAEDG